MRKQGHCLIARKILFAVIIFTAAVLSIFARASVHSSNKVVRKGSTTAYNEKQRILRGSGGKKSKAKHGGTASLSGSGALPPPVNTADPQNLVADKFDQDHKEEESHSDDATDDNETPGKSSDDDDDDDGGSGKEGVIKAKDDQNEMATARAAGREREKESEKEAKEEEKKQKEKKDEDDDEDEGKVRKGVVSDRESGRVSATDRPTKNPIISPTFVPTSDPTNKPTWKLTAGPTSKPTNSTMEGPTTQPISEPKSEPTREPTNKPSDVATGEPPINLINETSYTPTVHPTNGPTVAPTSEPTDTPTEGPTLNPTTKPEANGSLDREAGTEKPTDANMATAEPTTREPTAQPTAVPTTREPTAVPTTQEPTAKPTTKRPTASPTTIGPSPLPTNEPTTSSKESNPPQQESGTEAPTSGPTEEAIHKPGASPTEEPTRNHTLSPPSPSPRSDLSPDHDSPTGAPIVDSATPTLSPTFDPTIPPAVPLRTAIPLSRFVLALTFATARRLSVSRREQVSINYSPATLQDILVSYLNGIYLAYGVKFSHLQLQLAEATEEIFQGRTVVSTEFDGTVSFFGSDFESLPRESDIAFLTLQEFDPDAFKILLQQEFTLDPVLSSVQTVDLRLAETTDQGVNDSPDKNSADRNVNNADSTSGSSSNGQRSGFSITAVLAATASALGTMVILALVVLQCQRMNRPREGKAPKGTNAYTPSTQASRKFFEEMSVNSMSDFNESDLYSAVSLTESERIPRWKRRRSKVRSGGASSVASSSNLMPPNMLQGPGSASGESNTYDFDNESLANTSTVEDIRFNSVLQVDDASETTGGGGSNFNRVWKEKSAAKLEEAALNVSLGDASELNVGPDLDTTDDNAENNLSLESENSFAMELLSEARLRGEHVVLDEAPLTRETNEAVRASSHVPPDEAFRSLPSPSEVEGGRTARKVGATTEAHDAAAIIMDLAASETVMGALQSSGANGSRS